MSLNGLTRRTKNPVPDPDCSHCYQQICDINKFCLNGCIPGFAGGKCLNKCPPKCIDSMCDYNEKTGTYPCSIDCYPGYHGLQCKTPCEGIEDGRKCDRYSGTLPDCGGSGYGENCETSCEPNCGGLVCDNKGKCYKEDCVPGRYGADCSMHCQAECKRCHRETGKCLKAKDKDLRNWRSDYLGILQEHTRYLIAAISLLVSFICSCILYVCVKGYRNRNRKRLSEDRNVSNVTEAAVMRNHGDDQITTAQSKVESILREFKVSISGIADGLDSTMLQFNSPCESAIKELDCADPVQDLGSSPVAEAAPLIGTDRKRELELKVLEA